MKRHVKLFLSLAGFVFMQCSTSQFTSYVTRVNDNLFEDDKEYRFISFNIPNLHYIEDYLPIESTNPWRLPDEFEIRDALVTIKQLGGKVTRMYVFPMRKESDPEDYVRYVEAPGRFNEEAFKTLDLVLKVANEVGVRVIIPFVDNWKWWGGPMDYEVFRKKEPGEFWTDQFLISDFKQTINFVLNRKNTYTGTLYEDDKAILAWETGNELDATYSWTAEIAAYIKSIDKNHLVMDGVTFQKFTDEMINDPNTDILTTHYSQPGDMIANRNLFKGKKAYIIGEYGLRDTQSMRELSDVIINEGLTGGLIWSLRFRNRDGGFYNHFERQTFESYRYPGFASGEAYDEKGVFNLVREKAAQINNEQVNPILKPEKPVLLDIKDISQISWQGVVGALSYIIERKEEYVSDWEIISNDADESKYAYRPLFCDETAQVGKRYFYRMKAKNEAGESDYSNIAGPVEVKYLKLVDEFENFEKMFSSGGKLKLLTYEDLRKAKEDRNRLTGKDSSYIIYKLPESISEVELGALITNEDSNVEIFGSADGTNFEEIDPENEVYHFPKNDYGFFPAVKFNGVINQNGIKFLKVILFGQIQLSRIEIKYNEVK